LGLGRRLAEFVIGHWFEIALISGLVIVFEVTDLGAQILAGTVGSAPEPPITFARMCGLLRPGP
jgi:hypothetical protein